MSKLVKCSALAVFLGAGMGAAQADMAQTRGGITIKTDDGRFEAKIGGRVHLDAVSLDSDESSAYSTEGGSYFRRARLSLAGKAYGWEYKFENDFADSNDDSDADGDDPIGSFRDLYLATGLLGGKLTLGQFKPLRGMEELTSSNEITMIERPFTSASGLFSGRQFAIGAKYEGAIGGFTYGLAAQNNSVLRGNDSRTTEEPVISGRVTWAPIASDTRTLHLGLSASLDAGDTGNGARLRGRGKLPATDLGSSRTLAEAGAAANAEDKDASHVGFELAGKAGPFYCQAEYMLASYSDAYDDAQGKAENADVSAYYVMASWLVTGESKPYSKGLFKSPKPKASYGAWEIKARYDYAENGDQPAGATNERKLSVVTFGTNWYVNPNVRFMLEHSIAEDKTAQVDGEFVEPSATTLRTQYSF